MARATVGPLDLTPLRRHRDYRLLYVSQSVSFLGSMLTYLALPYQVYRLTHSSLAVGCLGLAELGPLLVTVFLGGALADAVDRRQLVLWTEGALAAGSGLLAVYALLEAQLQDDARLRVHAGDRPHPGAQGRAVGSGLVERSPFVHLPHELHQIGDGDGLEGA